ncbi:30S ribosome-binding factor RbfA [Rubeoparvulum massiliense]|uniref:30S ribosome-binding factor RbfA n=1 Tax=Rubeoparvulum massiliense TaxID=1631346 RepID=UPI00065E5548|nr:30S ribosome-binding factor RbfA [Rubeoparvulum massiliense]
MSKVRTQRIAEQMKKELGQLIQYELKDPRVGFVTVTGVEVSSDLQLAKVYVSVMGSQEEKETTLLGLDKSKGFLRKELGQRIQLRHTPELQFRLDESLDYGSHIDKILQDLHDKGE